MTPRKAVSKPSSIQAIKEALLKKDENDAVKQGLGALKKAADAAAQAGTYMQTSTQPNSKHLMPNSTYVQTVCNHTWVCGGIVPVAQSTLRDLVLFCEDCAEVLVKPIAYNNNSVTTSTTSGGTTAGNWNNAGGGGGLGAYGGPGGGSGSYGPF